MRFNYCNVLIAILLFSININYSFASVKQKKSISVIISNIGKNTTVDDLNILLKKRCDTFPLLISNLELITPGTIDPSEFYLNSKKLRVIWTIAALRYITGVDFTSKYYGNLASNYSEVGIKFLHKNVEKGRIKFFASWMSRGTIYISPTKVQKDIIKQWKNMYKTDKNCNFSKNIRQESSSFWFFGDNKKLIN